MANHSHVIPKYKIKLSPDIFEIDGEGDSIVTLTVTRNAAQPKNIKCQCKADRSPWEKDK